MTWWEQKMTDNRWEETAEVKCYNIVIKLDAKTLKDGRREYNEGLLRDWWCMGVMPHSHNSKALQKLLKLWTEECFYKMCHSILGHHHYIKKIWVCIGEIGGRDIVYYFFSTRLKTSQHETVAATHFTQSDVCTSKTLLTDEKIWHNFTWVSNQIKSTMCNI